VNSGARENIKAAATTARKKQNGCRRFSHLNIYLKAQSRGMSGRSDKAPGIPRLFCFFTRRPSIEKHNPNLQPIRLLVGRGLRLRLLPVLRRGEARLPPCVLLLPRHPAGDDQARTSDEHGPRGAGGGVMPGVSADQVRAAKTVDLLSYLQANEPGELVKGRNGEFRTAGHGSLVISNGRWFWNRGQFGGRSALDYLIKVRGMGFADAVETVCGSRASPAVYSLPAENTKPPPQKELALPAFARFPGHAVRYLQKRGIGGDVIQHCLSAGILAESRYKGSPVCVFIGRDAAGDARFACMRGIYTDLKQDCAGSDKRFGFRFPARNAESESLATFEAPMDALSHACLYPDFGGCRLSLGGVSAVALTAFLERSPHIAKIALCLDNDEAGQAAARKIQAALAGSHPRIAAAITPPIEGKDYNDMLIRVKQRERAGCHKTAGASL
jgi:hypothetical protein